MLEGAVRLPQGSLATGSSGSWSWAAALASWCSPKAASPVERAPSSSSSSGFSPAATQRRRSAAAGRRPLGGPMPRELSLVVDCGILFDFAQWLGSPLVLMTACRTFQQYFEDMFEQQGRDIWNVDRAFLQRLGHDFESVQNPVVCPFYTETSQLSSLLLELRARGLLTAAHVQLEEKSLHLCHPSIEEANVTKDQVERISGWRCHYGRQTCRQVSLKALADFECLWKQVIAEALGLQAQMIMLGCLQDDGDAEASCEAAAAGRGVPSLEPLRRVVAQDSVPNGTPMHCLVRTLERRKFQGLSLCWDTRNILGHPGWDLKLTPLAARRAPLFDGVFAEGVVRSEAAMYVRTCVADVLTVDWVFWSTAMNDCEF